MTSSRPLNGLHRAILKALYQQHDWCTITALMHDQVSSPLYAAMRNRLCTLAAHGYVETKLIGPNRYWQINAAGKSLLSKQTKGGVLV